MGIGALGPNQFSSWIQICTFTCWTCRPILWATIFEGLKFGVCHLTTIREYYSVGQSTVRSGAVIAWNYMDEYILYWKNRPNILRYIIDGDLKRASKINLPIQYVPEEYPSKLLNACSSDKVKNVARRAPCAFKEHCTEAWMPLTKWLDPVNDAA